jgi:hypothetical protein
MGEARRRRLAHERGEPASITWADGSRTYGRAAPSPRGLLTRHDELLRRDAEGERGLVAAVPCGKCTACCHIGWVPVDPGEERAEDLEWLDLVDNPHGGRRLRKRADGACVHLTPGGCEVYAHRPRACRLYDCRTKVLLAGGRAPYGGERASPHWIFDLRHGEDALTFLILTCARLEFDAMLARVPDLRDDHDERGAYGLKRLREVWPEVERLLQAAVGTLAQTPETDMRDLRQAVAWQVRGHMDQTAAAAQAAWPARCDEVVVPFPPAPAS